MQSQQVICYHPPPLELIVSFQPQYFYHPIIIDSLWDIKINLSVMQKWIVKDLVIDRGASFRAASEFRVHYMTEDSDRRNIFR
jgi:hypothetical protein